MSKAHEKKSGLKSYWVNLWSPSSKNLILTKKFEWKSLNEARRIFRRSSMPFTLVTSLIRKFKSVRINASIFYFSMYEIDPCPPPAWFSLHFQLLDLMSSRHQVENSGYFRALKSPWSGENMLLQSGLFAHYHLNLEKSSLWLNSLSQIQIQDCNYYDSEDESISCSHSRFPEEPISTQYPGVQECCGSGQYKFHDNCEKVS